MDKLQTDKNTDTGEQGQINDRAESFSLATFLHNAMNEGKNLEIFSKQHQQDLQLFRQKIDETTLKRAPLYLSLFILAIFLSFYLISTYENLFLFFSDNILHLAISIPILSIFSLIYIIYYINKSENTRKFFKTKFPESLEYSGKDGLLFKIKDTFIPILETLLPGALKSIETLGARTKIYHIMDNLWSSLVYYSINSQAIWDKLSAFNEIALEETLILQEMIATLDKADLIDSKLAFLSYYDYMKKPEIKGTIDKLAQDEKFQFLLSSVAVDGLKMEYTYEWLFSNRYDICQNILSSMFENDIEYSLVTLKQTYSTKINEMKNKVEDYVDNIRIFGIKDFSPEIFDKQMVWTQISDLLNGSALIDCVSKNTLIQLEKVDRSVFQMIYNYNEPTNIRRSLINEIGDDGVRGFSKFLIDQELVSTNSTLDYVLLSKIIIAYGDYKLDPIKEYVDIIYSLIDFLVKAKELLERLGFKIETDPSSSENVNYLVLRKRTFDKEDLKTYLEKFKELSNWEKEILKRDVARKYDKNKQGDFVDKYFTLLFILFYNGYFDVNPKVSTRKFNSFFSADKSLMQKLLSFIAYAESRSMYECPEIIIDILVGNNEEVTSNYLVDFENKFKNGHLPSFESIVNERNKASERVVESYKFTSDLDDYFSVDALRIMNILLDTQINASFFKSLIAGGVVKAYVFTKKGSDSLFKELEENDYHFYKFLKYLHSIEDKDEFLIKVRPEAFVRIEYLGNSTRIGLIPENLSFFNFTDLMNSYLIKFFKSIPNIELKYTKSYLPWDITPVDTTSVLTESADGILSNDYTDNVTKLLRKENINKKLVWLLSSRTTTSQLENVSIRDVIISTLKDGSLDFFDFLPEELKKSMLGIKPRIDEAEYKSLINKKINEITNMKNIIKNCVEIDKLGEKNLYKKWTWNGFNFVDDETLKNKLIKEVYKVSHGICQIVNKY
jgi:hypothetical protein